MRLLIVGLPRSGTTWVARVLGLTEDTCSVLEPDNEVRDSYAVRAKRGLGRFPALDPGDEAAEYETLWDRAFSGKVHATRPRPLAAKLLLKRATRSELSASFCRHDHPHTGWKLRGVSALAIPRGGEQQGRNVLVKSVQSPLSLDWIAERWKPEVLVVLRHPLNVLSSWIGLGFRGCNLDTHPVILERYVARQGIALLPPDASLVARLAWQFGILNCGMEASLKRNPGWHTVAHDSLCRDPAGGFERLSGSLGLRWSDDAGRFLMESNAPGARYAVKRVAGDQPDAWRRRLTDAQVREIRGVLDGFPLQRDWFKESAFED